MSDEWERHINTILQLYLLEGMSLNKVVEYMEKNHNFDKKKNQYERKLNQWKIRKNLKGREATQVWQYIGHHLNLRDINGKVTQVLIGDVPCPEKTLRRNVMRYRPLPKMGEIQSFNYGDRGPQPPHNVVIRIKTPPPTHSLVLYEESRAPTIISASKSLYRLMEFPLSIPTLVFNALKPFVAGLRVGRYKQEDRLFYSGNQTAIAEETLRLLLTTLANRFHRDSKSGVNDKMIIEVIEEIGRRDSKAAFELLSSQEPDMCAIKEVIFASAIQTRHISIIRQLLHFGVNPDLPILSFKDVEILIRNQWFSCGIKFSLDHTHTALHLAALKGDIELADILLQHGVDVDAESLHVDENISVRPMSLAALNPNHKTALEFSRLLLDRAANVNASCNPTPLMSAFARGNDNLVSLLLAHGAEIATGSLLGVTFLKMEQAQFGWHLMNKCHLKILDVAIITKNRRMFDRLIEDERVYLNCLEPNSLAIACLTGQLEMANKLIVCGANVNAQSNMMITPLMASAWDTTCQFPRICLDAGASIDYVPKHPIPIHPSAIQLAVRFGNTALVELLVHLGAKDFKDCLRDAIRYRQQTTFRFLRANLTGALLTSGELIQAILNRDNELAAELLSLGVNVLESDVNRRPKENVLWAAAKTGNQAMILRYFTAGGQYNSFALHAAVRCALKCKDDVVVRLIAQHRSPGPIDSEESMALVLSIQEMASSIIRILLDKAFEPHSSHCHPLEAALSAEPWVLESLLARGYTPSSGFWKSLLKGFTLVKQGGHYIKRAVRKDLIEKIWSTFPLSTLNVESLVHIMGAAVETGNCELIRKCLRAGAPVNSIIGTNTMGFKWTSLQLAVHWRLGQVARLLVDAGADVNSGPVKNSFHAATPLQYAAMQGDLEMAQFLISKGANVNAEGPLSGDGTALETAARYGRLDMVRLLLKEVNIQGEMRVQYIKSALYATIEGNNAIATLLTKHGGWSEDDQQRMDAIIPHRFQQTKALILVSDESGSTEERNRSSSFEHDLSKAEPIQGHDKAEGEYAESNLSEDYSTGYVHEGHGVSEIRATDRAQPEEGIGTLTCVNSLSHNIESLKSGQGTHISEEMMESEYTGAENCTQPLGIQEREFEHGLTGKVPVLMSEELSQDDPDMVQFLEVHMRTRKISSFQP